MGIPASFTAEIRSKISESHGHVNKLTLGAEGENIQSCSAAVLQSCGYGGAHSDKLWDRVAPKSLFAVEGTLQWSKKYFEQRGVTFPEVIEKQIGDERIEGFSS